MSNDLLRLALASGAHVEHEFSPSESKLLRITFAPGHWDAFVAALAQGAEPVNCDICHGDPEACDTNDCGDAHKPASETAAGAVTNPHQDYLARYWQDGFDGKPLGACTGSAPLEAWHAGKRAATPPAATQVPRAWERRWSADGEVPAKVNGKWPGKFKLMPVTKQQCLSDDAPLFGTPAAPPVGSDTGMREALKWCASALQGIVPASAQDGRVRMLDETGEQKTVAEILDMADEALSHPSQEPAPASVEAREAEALAYRLRHHMGQMPIAGNTLSDVLAFLDRQSAPPAAQQIGGVDA